MTTKTMMTRGRELESMPSQDGPVLDGELGAAGTKAADDTNLHAVWASRVAEVCDQIATGNLEARVIGCEEGGEIGRMVHGINRLLDITDAFVREAKAALDYASHGKFFRRVLCAGCPARSATPRSSSTWRPTG